MHDKNQPEYPDLHGHHLYFPLMECFRRFRYRELLAPEFKDFRKFFAWAIEHGYDQGASIRRMKQSLPASPENCYIVFPGEGRLPPTVLLNINGGEKNKPCHQCTKCEAHARVYCPSFRSCQPYTQWVMASWKNFNRYAQREAKKLEVVR